MKPNKPDKKNCEPKVCYLCGGDLAKLPNNEVNRDHVPPNQFFTKHIKLTNNLDRLVTIKTHKKCNSAYKDDEEYFTRSILPLVKGSYAGNSLFYDKILKSNSGKGTALSYLVLDEFEKRPFGLVLPIGKIVKRFDNKRYKRVAFKIARGLIFYEEGLLIDPNALHRITNFSFSDEIPNDVEIINYLPSKGKYPGVFDYKYYVTDKMVFVSMLLFDKLILNIYMQSPYTKSTTSLT